MYTNLPPQRMRPLPILASSLGFVLLLTLAACSSAPAKPVIVASPCQFPAPPMVGLPEVGYFHKRLDAILQTTPTSSPTPPTR